MNDTDRQLEVQKQKINHSPLTWTPTKFWQKQTRDTHIIKKPSPKHVPKSNRWKPTKYNYKWNVSHSSLAALIMGCFVSLCFSPVPRLHQPAGPVPIRPVFLSHLLLNPAPVHTLQEVLTTFCCRMTRTTLYLRTLWKWTWATGPRSCLQNRQRQRGESMYDTDS